MSSSLMQNPGKDLSTFSLNPIDETPRTHSLSLSTFSTSANRAEERIIDSLVTIQALCPKLFMSASIRQIAIEVCNHVLRMADFPKNPFVRSDRDKDKEKQSDEDSEGDKVQPVAKRHHEVSGSLALPL